MEKSWAEPGMKAWYKSCAGTGKKAGEKLRRSWYKSWVKAAQKLVKKLGKSWAASVQLFPSF